MRYRLAAGLLLVCLIPANICQGEAKERQIEKNAKREKAQKRDREGNKGGNRIHADSSGGCERKGWNQTRSV